jgi:hypothetical protein
VDDAGAMGRVERIGQRGAEQHDLVDVQAVALVEQLAQRLSRHVLHDHGLVARVAGGVVDGDDGGVVDAGDGDRLAPQPLDEGGVVGQVRVEELDRHLAAEDLVGPEPHLGHAADGEAPVEAVAASQPLRAHRRSRRRWERGSHGRRRSYCERGRRRSFIRAVGRCR